MPVRPPQRVDLLGGFRVSRAGPDHLRQPSARQQQLIAFLILHAAAVPVTRQRVAGSLWPDSTDAQALTNLRRELHHLRESWSDLERSIDVRSTTLAWRHDTGAAADVIAFEQAAATGLAGDRDALAEAARLYTGDLLPDVQGEWVESDRARLRERALTVLARLAADLERDGRYAEAAESAQRLLRLDPLREEAWALIIRCHGRRGDRAAAIQAFQQCTALLKEEIGVQPGAATRLAYRDVLDLDAAAAVAVRAPASTYPLVGRESEWRQLIAAWHTADHGRLHVLLIAGEAGIGKTRLAEELVDWCRGHRTTALAARCYPGEGRLAYAPVAAWLRSDAIAPALMSLPPSTLSDVARLHPALAASRADLPPASHLESWQRLRFFDALAAAFRAASPIVLLLDDVQWADADTLEWLQYFRRAAADARCLLMATVRSEEQDDNPALVRLLRDLARDEVLTTIALGPLDRAATAQLAGAVAEHPLDEAALTRTFRDTEGHPLFIVERGRMDAAATPAENVLSRVQSVVAARLALLSPEARGFAEVAAAIGRDFSFALLRQAAGIDEAAAASALDELWRRHIVRPQADDRWDFSHDRIREVAYAGIGPARAPLVHRRIAAAMEQLFAGRLDEESAALAVHLHRGGQPARAVPFLERAAAVAAAVSANEEAIRCLTYALSLLELLPAGRDRDQRELALRSSLSIVLNSARGYAAPDVEHNLERVLSLVRSGGQEVPARWLWVAFTMHFMLGDLHATRRVSEEALARSVSDPSCRCEAHHAMGGTLCAMGELEASRAHFELALAAYDEERPQQSALGSDLGVFTHGWYSHTLWLLGDEAAALTHADAAIALARRRDHLYSRTLAAAYAGLLHQMRRDVAAVVACANEAVSLCERYGFAYYDDWARVLLGWADAQQRPLEGARAIESALARLDAKRAQARRPYYLSLLAESYRLAGDAPRAASVLDTAIAMAQQRDDTWWLPALYGERAALERPAQRETTLRRALDVARAQQSRGLAQRILAAR